AFPDGFSLVPIVSAIICRRAAIFESSVSGLKVSGGGGVKNVRARAIVSSSAVEDASVNETGAGFVSRAPGVISGGGAATTGGAGGRTVTDNHWVVIPAGADESVTLHFEHVGLHAVTIRTGHT